MDPYIGITGFMTQDEVAHALKHLDDPSRDPQRRRLMVGGLVSRRTLFGGDPPTRYPGRYPRIERLPEIFTADPRALNLIHYVTDDRATLADQFARLITAGGPNLHGFQLNDMGWPDPGTLAPLKGFRVVLQLGEKALSEIKHDSLALAAQLDAYRDVITDVLVDASGGTGKALEAVTSLAHVRAIARRHPGLGIGVAGGLHAYTVVEVKPHRASFHALSIDAEGRLRTSEDALDLEEVAAYLHMAQAFFRQAEAFFRS